jgi:hypothetical protein
MDHLFEKGKNQPEAWLTTSTSLRKAADILFSHCPEGWGSDGEPREPDKLFVLAPATMLYGFAMENAIKGYLIIQHGGFDAAFAANNAAWKGHHLRELAIATGMALSEEQKRLLPTVDALICWAGRYPVSLARKGFTLKEQLNAGDESPPILLDKVQRDILNPLYKALTKALHNNLIARLSQRDLPPTIATTSALPGT